MTDAAAAEAEPAPTEHTCKTIIATDANIDELVDKALSQKTIGIYMVCTAPNAMEAVPAGIAVALSPDEAFYLEATEESAFDILRILKSEIVEKVGINLKFDMVVALNIAEKLAAPYYDVAIAHYLLQPEMSHSINRLAEIYLKKFCPTISCPPRKRPTSSTRRSRLKSRI